MGISKESPEKVPRRFREGPCFPVNLQGRYREGTEKVPLVLGISREGPACPVWELQSYSKGGTGPNGGRQSRGRR